ncbi:MAG: hypothetical protein M3P49_11840 [Actinomycetota bacterium]|nr:hypothetical protein [Actinomycetota bacterium]
MASEVQSLFGSGNCSKITRLEDGEGGKRRYALDFAGGERVTLSEPRHAVALARALGLDKGITLADHKDVAHFSYGMIEGAIDMGVAVDRDVLLSEVVRVEFANNLLARDRRLISGEASTTS